MDSFWPIFVYQFKLIYNCRSRAKEDSRKFKFEEIENFEIQIGNLRKNTVATEKFITLSNLKLFKFILFCKHPHCISIKHNFNLKNLKVNIVQINLNIFKNVLFLYQVNIYRVFVYSFKKVSPYKVLLGTFTLQFCDIFSQLFEGFIATQQILTLK